MSILTENVIPGNHGRIFVTNASSDGKIEKMIPFLKEIDGIKDVIIVKGVFPREFIVHTSKLLNVVLIEDTVKRLGLHAIPKGWFEI